MKTQVSFVRGEESDTGGGVAEILVTVDDSLLSSVFLPLHPLDRELSGPSLSCGCKAAGQSGCLSVTCVCACPSALVSIVVVHGGWAAGHYRGASSRCKVTCNSWTYRWQEDGDRFSTGVTGWESWSASGELQWICTGFCPIISYLSQMFQDSRMFKDGWLERVLNMK